MMVPEGPNLYSSKLSSLLGSSGAPCPNEEHFAPLERNRSFCSGAINIWLLCSHTEILQ